MQILVASVDATLSQLTGDSDSVVITLNNLRRRAPSPGATVDSLLVQARTFTTDMSNIAAFLQYQTIVNGAILFAAPEHLAATPAEQLKRILVGLQDMPSLSFLQEKHYNDASVTLQEVAEVERIIRRRLASGSPALRPWQQRRSATTTRHPATTVRFGKLGKEAHEPITASSSPTSPANDAACPPRQLWLRRKLRYSLWTK
jgi:hypothetical protein